LTIRQVMRAGILAIAVACTLAVTGAPANAATAEDLEPVDVVAVSGLLDHVVVHAIHEALQRSQENGAQAVVLQVNSLGAIVDATRMQELLQEISDATVPVAVWVGPTGARAYGWSAQLLAVADVTAMAPGARVGYSGKLLEVDGEPVSFGEADSTLRASSMGFDEAREAGVLNYAGTDEGVPVVRNMLLALDGIQVDGIVLDTVVETVDASGQVVRDATTARFFKLDLMGQLMHTVASPPVAYLLFIIGLALLIFELFTAGIGIAGIVGATSLVLGTYGLAELPTRPIAVILTLLAAFLDRRWPVVFHHCIIRDVRANRRDRHAPVMVDTDLWHRNGGPRLHCRYAVDGTYSICYTDYRSRVDDRHGGYGRDAGVARWCCGGQRCQVASTHESRHTLRTRRDVQSGRHRWRDTRG
jgi:membrane-bound serine protease (ClpP class)